MPLSGTVTNSTGLDVYASTGATHNYAALFETGNVGIGTASPQNLLDVNGAASIGYNVAAPSNGLIVSGNVGIATASPQSELHVYGGEVQVGSSGASCTSANAGALRYSGSTQYYCNGNAWVSAATTNTIVYLTSNWYQMPTIASTAVGSAMTAGSIYFYPFFIPQPITIDQLAFYVNTGAAGGSAYWNVGIYSNNASSQPGTRLAAGAGSNSTSTGNTAVSLNSNLSITTPGWYWLAFQAADTTMKTVAAQDSNGVGRPNASAQNLGNSSLTYVMSNSSAGYIMAGSVQTSAGYANITMPTTTSSLSWLLNSLMPVMAYHVYSIP